MLVEALEQERAELRETLRSRASLSTITRQQEEKALDKYHVSSLLRSIMESLSLLKPRARAEGDDPSLRFEVGWVWEDMLGQLFFRRPALREGGLLDLGTLEEDGILGTPDDFDDGLWMPNEYKATWSSSRRPIDERNRWYWLQQMRAYCWMTQAESAKLKVLYVNGDWRPPQPDIGVYLVRFSPAEIEATWHMLRTHREWLQEGGDGYRQQ